MRDITPWLIMLAATGGAVPGLWIMTRWFAARQRYRRLRRILVRVRHERDVLRFQMNTATVPAKQNDDDPPVRAVERTSPGRVRAPAPIFGKRIIGFEGYMQNMTVAAITTAEQRSSE